MTVEPSNRLCIRGQISAPVKLYHPKLGPMNLLVEDISDGGAFVVASNTEAFMINDEVAVQIIDFVDKEPEPLAMRVV